MGVTTTQTNKPLNPRAQDASPLAYNRAALYSGKALDFDGVNDLATITGSNTLSFSAITLSAYFKFDNLGATQAIFAKRKDVASYWSAGFIMSSSGELDFRTTTGTTEYKAVYSDFVTGEYYHVVGINDGLNNYLYVNGQLVDTTASGAIDNTTTYNFVLGNNATGQYYYNGQISNAKIFNTALTAAQIADLYNNPEKIVPTGVDNTALKLWLPMMEGAGTTAYDGSGNGNHGTIAGATYVNGVGAPVAQTSVIDWNKGVNKLPDSSDLENGTHWIRSGDTAVESGYSAPNGTNTAFKVTGTNDALVDQATAVATDYRAIWARTTSGIGTAKLTSYHGNTNNLFTITEEWQKFSVDSSISTGGGNFYVVDFRGSGTLNEVIVWQPHLADSESVLAPTIGTAQTTPVLLPAGLTTGRDITGVNLFENVRKQSALNLDGQSWAEVHDNASLDVTTAVTLEAWVYWDGSNSSKGILGRWFSGNASYMLYANNSTTLYFFINTSSSAVTISGTGWKHIVGTYDSTTRRVYIDGQEIGSGDAYNATIDVNDKPIEIGRYAGNTAYEYDGEIAQPRIYNRALSAEEVQKNYNAGKNIYS